MSDQIAGVVDPDVQVAAPPDPVAQEPPVEPSAQEPAEDDIPDAVELQAGVKYVPIGVVRALREELKTVKPLAQRAQELERESADNRAIVEFIRANPQLMQPPAAPVAAPQSEDPALIEYARTLDLYTADGKPDTTRAAKLREMTRADAQAIAQQAIAPMQEVTHEQRAATQIQQLVNGGIAPEFIAEAVRHVLPQQMPKAEALQVMASPHVMNLIKLTATGLQASAKAAAPAPAVVAAPDNPPLYREPAGGGTPLQVSEDHTKKLGIKHDDYVKAASRYVAGRANSLE